MRKDFIFTSESVSEGHPDKVSDRISDAVVDHFIAKDPYARVACETLTTTNKVVLSGEIRGPVQEDKDEIISKDLDQIRNLFDDIEKKTSFVEILETAGKAKGVQIFIGSKNFLFKHSGLSMVMAPYKNNDQEIIGAIGVVGPTRLNYSKIVPLVDYTSKIIGKVID